MYSLHSACNTALVKLDLSPQDCQPVTAIAPSLILKLLSGIIKSSSNSILYPSPRHSGQAPKGLLNEKLLGSISLMPIPQSGQEKLWLNVMGSPPITSTTKSPSANSSTFSMESARRRSIPAFTTRRSTTISILCLIFFSREISSVSSYRLPSIRTRTYPLLLARSNTLACSPLRPRTTGARSCNLVPSGTSII